MDPAEVSVQRCESGEDHGLLIRELRHERQIAAHRFHLASQRRNQQVATLLEARHAVLTEARDLSPLSLRQLVGATKLLQGLLSRDDRRCECAAIVRWQAGLSSLRRRSMLLMASAPS